MRTRTGASLPLTSTTSLRACGNRVGKLLVKSLRHHELPTRRSGLQSCSDVNRIAHRRETHDRGADVTDVCASRVHADPNRQPGAPSRAIAPRHPREPSSDDAEWIGAHFTSRRRGHMSPKTPTHEQRSVALGQDRLPLTLAGSHSQMVSQTLPRAKRRLRP